MTTTSDSYLEYGDPGIDLDNFDVEAEIAKFSDLEVRGWNVYLRLYTEPKKKGSILLAEKVRDEDKYKNCVGLVVQIAPDAYTDPRYTRPWCKVGEWVHFARHSGYRMLHNELPLWVIKEDAVDGAVTDPRTVSKYVY